MRDSRLSASEETSAGGLLLERDGLLAELERRLAVLSRKREIVAYCRGPYCVYADDAVRLLRSKGLKARRLDIGFPEWNRAGMPVEIAS